MPIGSPRSEGIAQPWIEWKLQARQKHADVQAIVNMLVDACTLRISRGSPSSNSSQTQVHTPAVHNPFVQVACTFILDRSEGFQRTGYLLLAQVEGGGT